MFTRIGVDRILRYAFELAPAAGRAARHVGDQVERHLPSPCRTGTSGSRRWPRAIPDVRVDQYHIDILCAHFVQRAERFDVVVGSNLFGDILSDLGPGVHRHDRHRALGQPQPRAAVSVDVRAGARLRARTSRAQGIANPIGQIWSAAMMLEHLGQKRRGRRCCARSSACWRRRARRARAISAAAPARPTSAARSPTRWRRRRGDREVMPGPRRRSAGRPRLTACTSMN